jgi:hypothetical protein
VKSLERFKINLNLTPGLLRGGVKLVI